MIRYLAASATARGFSASPATRRLYRRWGNSFETWRRRREGLPERYLVRLRRTLSIIEGLELPARPKVLEVGTGFVHWEALSLALRLDAEVTLYDIVDNRLPEIFFLYAAQLREQQAELGPPGSAEATLARERLASVSAAAPSLADVYRALGWEYVLDPTGTMEVLPSDTYDLVASSDVLEHIDRSILPTFMAQLWRTMRPGAVTFHSIGLRDHLANYDPKAPAKFYYRYSGPTWDRVFNSEVQYINRVQRSEWLRYFTDAGFELIHEEVPDVEPHGVKKLHVSYTNFDQSDLDARTHVIVFRKPADSLPSGAPKPLS